MRELVENEELIVPFVSTTANMADFFTKPLAREAFFRLRNSIMNLPPRSGSAARSSGAGAADLPSPVSLTATPAPCWHPGHVLRLRRPRLSRWAIIRCSVCGGVS